MQAVLGPASLLFSNLMIIVVLVAMRSFDRMPSESLLLLAVGNFFCASLVLFPRLTGQAHSPLDKRALLVFAGWSLCYTTTYGIYALFPKAVTLSDLIIAESLAPTAAVVLSGDWRHESARWQKLAANLALISLLLVLAYLKREPGSETSGEAFLILVMTVCFLGTNIAARHVAKLGPALWGQARVSLFNGLALSVLIASIGTQAAPGNLGSELLAGAGFAACLAATQGSFIFGLARTPPFLSALLISTSVPLSLFSDAVLANRPLISREGALGIFYCLMIWLTQRWFAKEETTPITAQTSSLQKIGGA